MAADRFKGSSMHPGKTALFVISAISVLSGLACTEQSSDSVTQILFGDLHVHSSFSTDAAIQRLSVVSGQGPVTPAQHCNYARYCAQLDFWSITDHPVLADPELWRQAKKDIIACNEATGGTSENPTMVSFLGFEWAQNHDSPSASWGHRNIIFRDPEQVPARSIAPRDSDINRFDVPVELRMARSILERVDPQNSPIYEATVQQVLDGIETPICASDVNTLELPLDCIEQAETPSELYEKLDDWGFDALAVLHGATWGLHHPATASWRYQLDSSQHSTKYDRLVEIYSGHGNGEQYRSWRHAEKLQEGTTVCPERSDDFEPCCYRAGEIVRLRSATCAADPEGNACQEEVAAARQAYLNAANNDEMTTVADTDYTDWLDCGQCRDCFQPAHLHRPMFSTQAALAMSGFQEAENPVRFRFGFVGSTDDHSAGPGAGYKEFKHMTDIPGSAKPEFDYLVDAFISSYADFDRMTTYLYSGGLIAVHAKGRSRDPIWDALMSRHVYGTSGERIQLWFDLVNGPGGARLPMGSVLTLNEEPRFEVKAIGSYRQLPGCPEWVRNEAPDGFVEAACRGECYNPSDERYLITNIDVVKVTPQSSAGEALDELIIDPWKTFECAPDPEGCTKTFGDPDYLRDGRASSYYVRARQEPTPQVNNGNLRCDRDEDGSCIMVTPCIGGHRGRSDDCIAEGQERAWSSPIYLQP